MKSAHKWTRAASAPHYLRVPGLNLFSVTYDSRQQPAFASQTILDNPGHVLHEATLAKLAKRDPESLWWNASSNKINAKKVVRTWCSRRLRIAFTKALEAKGYDREGRPQGLSSEALRTGKIGLRGSLQLLGSEKLTTAKFSEVEEQTEAVLNSIIELCSKRERRRSHGDTVTPHRQIIARRRSPSPVNNSSMA